MLYHALLVISSLIADAQKFETNFFTTLCHITFQDVFNSVRRKYSSPPSSIFQNETLLSEFTRVVINVAWHMTALDPPVVTASAIEGDIIRETRYRRSYMSEFSSTIIHHYIWPCLLRRGRILTKGEVVTRRISVYDQKILPKVH